MLAVALGLGLGLGPHEREAPRAGGFLLLSGMALECELLDQSPHLLVLLGGTLGHGLQLHLQVARPCLGLVELVVLGALFRLCVDQGRRQLAVGLLIAAEKSFGVGEEVVEGRRGKGVNRAVRKQRLRQIQVQQLIVGVVVGGRRAGRLHARVLLGREQPGEAAARRRLVLRPMRSRRLLGPGRGG